ncbi:MULTISPECIES: bifunctional mannitol-1-phosphate dehydrogenase/phosphatase [unclassified Acinetobacter]|uniref:bifunctional mannitol-1-phosphate dehydrogenase/phosphatase n=1 Tax=unclassified Acinetobacter TaxID=196816 RepID=UPI0015D2C60B|nr:MULTISPECIES: HAD family hydrolase [unclassified Acinetobacter]
MLKFNNDLVLGAIFDMDGTMFDTERLRFQTLKQASLELIGVEFSESYLMNCLGLSAQSAHRLAQAEYDENIPYADIRKRADELELEHVRQFGVPIKKGLVQVLERLRKSGLRMAVATSSRRAIAEEYLINANVYKFFDVLVCGDEVENGKPHPEIFMRAAAKLNLNPADCLMFEDSENGVTSAFEAGGITVLFKDIKSPNQNMLSKAKYYYECMYDCLTELDPFTAHLEMPHVQEAFPQTLNQLTVGIHGFGAIGGGYLAQILSHWDGYTRPKKIYASTRNPLYRSAVNAFGTYCIRYGQLSYDERIENMAVIDAENIQQMQEMYTESSLVAICLPEKAIAEEAKTIAQGLYARHIAHDEKAIEPLTMLIILNKVGAKQLLMSHLKQALTELAGAVVAEKIMQQHYFCDTVVNRMVSKLSDQNLYRQLRIKYNIFKQFQLDEVEVNAQLDLEDATKLNPDQERQATLYVEDMRRNFHPSHILQSMDLILFNAESDMPIYVENNSPLLEKMRQMILVDHIEDIQLIKNRLWNGVHAMLAWQSALFNHQTIGVALADHRVDQFMHELIDEVQAGLARRLPNRAFDLTRLAESFINSCEHAYKDPCARVARDPLRKLAINERVLGSLATNVKYGLETTHLQQGIVYGLMYAVSVNQCSMDQAINFIQLQFSELKKTNELEQLERIEQIEANVMIQLQHFSDQFTEQFTSWKNHAVTQDQKDTAKFA